MSGNTVGWNNVALGFQALSGNNTADGNSAVGIESLKANTSGSNNVAFGAFSSRYNTTGSDNVAVGVNSLKTNTTGMQNTAIGKESLNFNTDGRTNVAVGRESLYNNTPGSYNTIVGSAAGSNNTTGSRNVFIGNSAGSNSNYETASDKLVIANSDTETPLIEGDFSAKTLKVNGSIEANSITTSGIGDRYYTLDLDVNVGGQQDLNLSNALGISNKTWLHIEIIRITSWSSSDYWYTRLWLNDTTYHLRDIQFESIQQLSSRNRMEWKYDLFLF